MIRIPEGVIEIAVEAKIVAIDITSVSGANTWDFGILDEAQVATAGVDNFTVRNTGNVAEQIMVHGTDAQSMPGEPVTTWYLDSDIGVNHYKLTLLNTAGPDMQILTADNTPVGWGSVAEAGSINFGLSITAPSVITTPARMWARVVLTAVAA